MNHDTKTGKQPLSDISERGPETQVLESPDTRLIEAKEALRQAQEAVVFAIRELEEKDRLLTAFDCIGQGVLSSLDLEQVLDTLALQIVEAGVYRSLTVALVDEASRRVEVVRGLFRSPDGRIGRDPRKAVGTSYSLDDHSIMAEVARTGKMEVVVGWDPRFDPRFSTPAECRGTAAFFIPVVKEDRVLAVLATGSRVEDVEETRRRIEVMRPLLGQMAVALEHARLYREARRYARELSRINNDLKTEIAERRRAERELKNAQDELEKRVEERTADLAESYALLKRESSDRKQAEEARRKSEETFHRMAANIKDVLYSVDVEKNEFRYLSPAFARLVGYSLEDVREMGGRVSFLSKVVQDGRFSAREQNANYERLRKSRERGSSVRSEAWWRCKDGSLRCLEDHWIPVYEDGRLTGTDGVLRDITERRLADEEIRRSLKEKEVLLKEIHHRVRNNLQIISSLLDLQTECVGDRATGMLRECRTRIQSMALIHETLYQAKDISRLNFGEYTRNLTASLLSAFAVCPESLTLTLDISDVFLKLDTAMYCGLMITELVTNSLKHAFPPGQKGEIRITVNTGPGESLSLKVSDDGIGLPEGLDFRKAESLGLKLVRALVEQLNGQIDIRSGRGTEVDITLHPE